MILIIVLIPALLIAWFLQQYFFKWSKMPPGPWGVPILGYAPYLSKSKVHDDLIELGKKYDKIFSMSLPFGTDQIVVTDPDYIKEMFQMEEFLARPNNLLFNYISRDGHGFITSVGQIWQENRRFGLRTLRDFGFGKSTVQELIQRNVQQVVEKLKQEAQNPEALGTQLHIAMVNTLWEMVANESFDHSDPQLHNFLKQSAITFKVFEDFGILFFSPTLLKILPKSWTGMDKLDVYRGMWGLFDDKITEHQKTLDPDFDRDYIDCFLKMQQKDPQNPSWSTEELIVNVTDLFAAGSETTSATIRWFVLHMAKHPEVQRLCQQEVDREVGKDREIELTDRAKLHYIEATIMETLRMTPVAPMNVTHSCARDTYYKGYLIPANSWIVGAVYSCHMDPKLFPNPHQFDPTRFLDTNGHVKTLPGWMPFSQGKRQCLGESLARMNLFMYVANFMQKFSFSEDPKAPFPESYHTAGHTEALVLRAPEVKLCVTVRD